MSISSGTEDRPQYHVQSYTPRHSKFPYSKADLTPSDTLPAPQFYTSPRYVAHIDGTAIAALQKYYAHHLLPPQSSPGEAQRVPRVLDFCTSHLSHLPPTLEALVQQKKLWMAGIGMNASEMQRNPALGGGWQVRDLDAEPHVAASSLLRSAAFDRGQVAPDDSSTSHDTPLPEEQKLDASTCVVSADYLRRPVAVLSSLRQATRTGGSVHLVVSNRCFPTKAVARWLRVGEAERLHMCGDYLWWAGWRDVEIVTLHDGSSAEESQQQTSRVAQLLRGLGVAGMGSDPLWVVRGRNTGEAPVQNVPDDV